MASAATQYLYSGEQFDARTGLQYLRGRDYRSQTGTFNTVDPFFGNMNDPQSFHKYRFTSGDPIQFGDPTGNMEGLIGTLGAMTIRGGLLGAGFGAGYGMFNAGSGYLTGQADLGTALYSFARGHKSPGQPLEPELGSLCHNFSS